jgi:hypothetical protein
MTGAPLHVVAFETRLLVLIRWSISFATRGRGVLLITSPANADAAGRPRPSRTIDASKRGLAGRMTGARKEPVVFVEPDARQDADDTAPLDWDPDTGETRIVVADIRADSLLGFPIPGANADEGFRHPFRYAR